MSALLGHIQFHILDVCWHRCRYSNMDQLRHSMTESLQLKDTGSQMAEVRTVLIRHDLSLGISILTPEA